MKRFITSLLFTLTIIVLYQFININLFTIDLSKRIRCELFKVFRVDPRVDLTIVIADIEYMELNEVKKKLEVLDSLGPMVIGVNLCNIKDTSKVLANYLSENKKIITCDCNANSNKGTSRITSSENEVAHFLTDKSSYFELQLANRSKEFQERGNDKERINFRAKNMYYQLPLGAIDNTSADLFKDKIVLVGFLRDSLITPMNQWYGRTSVNEGDMSDVEISANIISTINSNEFINEINPFLQGSVILLVSLLNTWLLSLLRTKRDVLNVLLAVVFFIILNGLSTALIVLAFSESYYLNIDGMTIVLLISSIVSVYWNTKNNKTPAIS